MGTQDLLKRAQFLVEGAKTVVGESIPLFVTPIDIVNVMAQLLEQ
jgi:hypothetical protein